MQLLHAKSQNNCGHSLRIAIGILTFRNSFFTLKGEQNLTFQFQITKMLIVYMETQVQSLFFV